jgi:integrase
MPRINFSEQALRALRPPASGRTTYWDKDVKGFGLRVTSNGARTFVVQRRPEGSAKPVTVTLDHFTGRNLIAARKLAEQAFSDLKKGKRPRDRKLELKESTLGALAEQFIKAELRSKRQGHQCENALRNDWLGQVRVKDKWRREKLAKGWRLVRVPQGWTDGLDRMLRDRPAALIERREIVARLDAIKAERTPHAARHALDAIRRLMNWCAAGHRGGVEVSPVASLSARLATGLAGDDLRRDRVLSDTELAAIWHAAGSDAFGSLVKLLILTGQRRGDWSDAAWPEISRTDDGDVLVIPGERYKNKREHRVPLSPKIVRLLRGLPRFDGSDWVLSNDGKVALGSFTRPKRRLDKASGVTGWVLHDLRRTVRSHMPGLDVPRDVSERLLGHAQHVLDRVYDHHNYTPQVRAALEAWERRLDGIIAKKRQLARRPALLEAVR